jgi:hypothetical protein
MMERMKTYFEEKAETNFNSAKDLLQQINALHKDMKDINSQTLYIPTLPYQQPKGGNKKLKESDL